MQKILHRPLSLLILALVLASCAKPVPTQAPPPTTIPAETQATPTSAPTTVSTPEVVEVSDDKPADETEPLPDLYDLYLQGIQSDPAEQGKLLVRLLQYAVGDIPLQEASQAEQVRASEITPLIRQASLWVELEGKGTPEAEEISMLLKRLLPDADAILPYAQPESKASRPNGLASMVRLPAAHILPQPTSACRTIFDDGFPVPPVGEPVPMCVLYRDLNIAGVPVRIFYPQEWGSDSGMMGYIDTSETSVIQSITTYKPLSSLPMPPIDIIFTLLAHSRRDGTSDPNTYAAAKLLGSGTCGVGVYPHTRVLSIPHFEQALAHELFHCFQYVNYSWTVTSDPSIDNWWVEGSAEYFSNAAFPTNNAEYEYIGDLDFNIHFINLFDLDYENFYYFQHLANTVGNAQIVSLLSTMPPAGGMNAFAAALIAGIPDYADFFQQYAKSYVDRQVVDTSGSTIPVTPRPYNSRTMGRGTITFNVEPHVVTLWLLEFPEHRIYTLSNSTEGEGKKDFRYQQTRGVWQVEIPENINTMCDEQKFIMATTSVDSTGYVVNIESQYEEPEPDSNASCDRCLVGTWQMTPESVDAFISSNMPPNSTYVGHTGRILSSFTTDGNVSGAWEEFTVTALLSIAGVSKQMTIEYIGTSTGNWYTIEGFLYGINSISNLKMVISGEDIVPRPIQIGDPEGTSSMIGGPYLCNSNTLSFTPPVEPLFTREFFKVTP